MVDIIFGFLSSLAWGFFLATGISALTVWLLVQFFNIERMYQLIVGALVWLMLFVQISALVAALKADDYVEGAQTMVAALGIDQAKEAADEFLQDYPVVYKFVDKQNLSAVTAVPSLMLDKIHNDLMSFAWRRVAWSVGFIALAFAVCGFFLSRPSLSSAQLDPFNNSPGGAGGVQF